MNGIAGAEIKMLMPGTMKMAACELKTAKRKNCSGFWIVYVNAILIGSSILLAIMRNMVPVLNLVFGRWMTVLMLPAAVL